MEVTIYNYSPYRRGLRVISDRKNLVPGDGIRDWLYVENSQCGSNGQPDRPFSEEPSGADSVNQSTIIGITILYIYLNVQRPTFFQTQRRNYSDPRLFL